MAIDPLTAAKLWMIFRPIRMWKEHRAAKRAARKAESDAAGGEFLDFDEEISMDIRAFLVQAVLAALRHAMTALAPLGVVVTDDWLLQTSAVIVGVAGYLWSLKRKAKPAV